MVAPDRFLLQPCYRLNCCGPKDRDDHEPEEFEA